MAGTAPTSFQFTRKFDAGPVHCSGWLCEPADSSDDTGGPLTENFSHPAFAHDLGGVIPHADNCVRAELARVSQQ